MPLTIWRSIFSALLLACLASNAPAQDAASPAAQQPTLQLLLNEVRLLRAALERSNQLAPRIQIALARMQFQEERVRIATRRLEAAHDAVSNAQRRRAELADRIKNVESQANQTVDPNVRKDLEGLLASVKAELENVSAQEEQNRAREGESIAALQSEQARWNEVNEQLVSLERGLTVP
jgi:hypothetical protein